MRNAGTAKPAPPPPLIAVQSPIMIGETMRTSMILLATLGLLSAGCSTERGSDDGEGDGGTSFSGASGGGVWLLALGAASDGGSSATCNENLSDADCPDDPDEPDPDPEWSGSADNTQSPELFFVQILGGGSDDAFLIVDDEVYPGEIDGNDMWFEWTHRDDSESNSEHDSGYEFTLDTEDTTRTRYEFERDGSGITGRRIDTNSFSWESTESDEWDSGDVGFNSGQLNAWPYLEGDADNSGSNDECSGSTCSVSITSESAVEYSLSGSLTDYDDETYDLLRDVGQNAGDDN
jgi:hypothetical protein